MSGTLVPVYSHRFGYARTVKVIKIWQSNKLKVQLETCTHAQFDVAATARHVCMIFPPYSIRLTCFAESVTKMLAARITEEACVPTCTRAHRQQHCGNNRHLKVFLCSSSSIYCHMKCQAFRESAAKRLTGLKARYLAKHTTAPA